ncbi:hypothetical protein MJM25_29795, partial [Salmonella enterica subsp. enterica serovar Lubbock]|nr:hypothetical protein [Salmonella enterica subsp. enterica serovar Lubbock]
DARIGLLAGRGAGAELMQAAICWAQSRGKATLRVATQLGNTARIILCLAIDKGESSCPAKWVNRPGKDGFRFTATGGGEKHYMA